MQKSNLIIIGIVALICAVIPLIYASLFNAKGIELLGILILGPLPNFIIGAVLAAAILWFMNKAEMAGLWIKMVVFLGATIASLPFAFLLFWFRGGGVLKTSLCASFSYVLLHPLILLTTFVGCFLLFIFFARFFRIRWSFLICAVILPMIVAGAIFYVEREQGPYLPSGEPSDDISEQIGQIIASGDVENCKSLSLKWRPRCVVPIAITSKDFTLCENIFSPEARNACYELYARSTNDAQVCDHIQISYLHSRKANRQSCLNAIS